MADLAPLRRLAQSPFELDEGEVEGRVPVVGGRLGPDGGPTRLDRELDPFAPVGLPWVPLGRYLHIDPDCIVIELLELGQLRARVSAEALRDTGVPALEGDFHLDPPTALDKAGVDTRPADLVFDPTSAC
jgi:hypothetical protein